MTLRIRSSNVCPRFAMAVVARPGGFYAELTQIAAFMLRRSHPNAEIHLVLDSETEVYLHRQAPELMADVAGFHVVDGIGDTPRELAWGLKTLARRYVPGDFVLLDVDAIIVRPVDELFQIDADAGAVLDRHSPIGQYDWPKDEWRLFEELNWKIPDAYLNSGVVVFRDTPGAHRLGETWHHLWLEWRQAGRIDDQPALNAAVTRRAGDLVVLPGKYNCQFQRSLGHLRDASILHFFTVCISDQPDNVLSLVVSRLRREGVLDRGRLEQLAEDRYPWLFEWFEALWACGQFRRALCHLPSAVAAKLLRRLSLTRNTSCRNSEEILAGNVSCPPREVRCEQPSESLEPQIDECRAQNYDRETVEREDCHVK